MTAVLPPLSRTAPADGPAVGTATVPAPAVVAPQPAPPATNEGYCACCRSQTSFVEHGSWLRDFYTCRSCGSVPRQRHLQTVLDEYVPAWHDLVLHESSPSNDFLSRWSSAYSSSQFFADVPRGSYRDGVRSEDVEQLTYADESIDVFITQDVLEHVFRPDLALQDIHRVLKPGGVHVFTAPKHRSLDLTRQRAVLTDAGVVRHLLPEEYHGNPIGDNKALVTWDYGYDFESLASSWVGVGVQTHSRLDRGRGIDAEFNEVFVIRKPGPTPTPALADPAPVPAPPARGARATAARGLAHLARRLAPTAS